MMSVMYSVKNKATNEYIGLFNNIGSCQIRKNELVVADFRHKNDYECKQVFIVDCDAAYELFDKVIKGGSKQ